MRGISRNKRGPGLLTTEDTDTDWKLFPNNFFVLHWRSSGCDVLIAITMQIQNFMVNSFIFYHRYRYSFEFSGIAVHTAKITDQTVMIISAIYQAIHYRL